MRISMQYAYPALRVLPSYRSAKMRETTRCASVYSVSLCYDPEAEIAQITEQEREIRDLRR